MFKIKVKINLAPNKVGAISATKCMLQSHIKSQFVEWFSTLKPVAWDGVTNVKVASVETYEVDEVSILKKVGHRVHVKHTQAVT